MCVIAYKPKTAEMPDYKTLKNCFENNEDGAGYMFAHNGKVHIVKGLMTFSGFIKSLTSSVKKFGQDIPYVLHFRWSTQAGVTRDCTHPFPLSKSMDDLRKLKTDCDIGIAHNGIIHLTSSYDERIAHSDTMEFITDYLSLIIKDREYYKDKRTIKLIDRLTDSKLAILDGGGPGNNPHCELTGGKWIEEKGCFYSNDGFQDEKLEYFGTGFQQRFTGLRPLDGQASFFGQGAFLGQEEYPEELLHYERFYNQRTGLYEFDNVNCPAFEDSDESFCEVCRDYKACYGRPEPLAHGR